MRNSAVLLALALTLGTNGCSKAPSDRLQGKWRGQEISNVAEPHAADAATWAHSVRFEFDKNKMTVSIPSEPTRSGAFEVEKVSGDKVTLRIARDDGRSDAANVKFKGSKLLWDVGEGRDLVMTRAD